MSAAAPARVLVVEDDQDVRETILETLEDLGLQVAGAVDGASALQLLRAQAVKPQLILLDLRMPGMNGSEFRRQQLQDPALAGIPVVLLSADMAAEQACSALGVAGFLTKPVKLDILVEQVERFIREERPLVRQGPRRTW